MNNALLTTDQTEALATGNWHDVFSLLGAHQSDNGQQRITVMVPGAVKVEVLARDSDRVLAESELLHKNGLYSAVVNEKDFVADYRLRVHFPFETEIREDPYRFGSVLSDEEQYLFAEGSMEKGWQTFGARNQEIDGIAGVLFTVWAPNAKRVSVVADFNHWDGRVHIMRLHPGSGIHELFIPGVSPGAVYKYEICSAEGNILPLKADPYAQSMQLRPDTGSVVPKVSRHVWKDEEWMQQRQSSHLHHQPLSIFEVHAGSWKRVVEEGSRYLSYRELADELISYVSDLGFSHIQFMPLSEYPFDGSWGYQPLGLYAPTSRFGSPDDLRYLIDTAHQAGIGVLLDWVPGHFPSDAHGLGRFDGTCLYEHEDLRKGFHPDWNTLIFNYGRREVCSYLISNVFYWLEEFHIDGLRFDAVASMLYLDYSRKHGEWLPNQYGGRENLEAIELLREINCRAYFNYPGILMIAEESTAWPGVTNYTDQGGLGFGFKWNLGWMNDTLSYLGRDPIHRKYHHNELTFGFLYAFSEKFILPLSHDEVVHGKGSIIARVPGDDWQKFATVRAYYGFMFGHPGKKLLFMGDEFAQRDEWNHDKSLDWHLLDYEPHQGIQKLVRDLNRVYHSSPSLYECDGDASGFSWVDADNHGDSVFAFLRHTADCREYTLVVVNMTPQTHHHVQLGVPLKGRYEEIFNSDALEYGGSGQGNMGGVDAGEDHSHGYPCSVNIVVPPLATAMFRVQQ